jgi:hypothetical protein
MKKDAISGSFLPRITRITQKLRFWIEMLFVSKDPRSLLRGSLLTVGFLMAWVRLEIVKGEIELMNNLQVRDR